MKSLGYYAKDKNGNLFQFEWTKDDVLLIDGISVSAEDYEILELILTYCIRRIDTKPIAKALLRKFKTLGAVLDADEEDLQSVSGIGFRSATLLKLFREVGEIYLKSGLK